MTSDSSHILAGGNDGNIYLLDNSGRLVDRRDAGGAISALSISDVTHLTIVGTVSGTISLYSADAGFNNGESLETGTPITSAAISKNGRRISVANLQGTVSTFDGSLRAPLWTYDAGGIVHSLSLSRDGRVLAAASDTGSIYLFDEGEAAGADNRGLFVQLPILAVLAVTVTVCTILLRRRDKSKRLRNETNEGHASDLASSFAKRAG
jgi:WD40 repeat protein